MRLRAKIHAWAVCLLWCAAPALANDTSVGDENGTLVFQRMPDVRMASEALSISRDRVEVDYVFVNTGKRDVVTTVAFPMPPMYFDDGDHSDITDFSLAVDGRAQPTSRSLVVKLGDEDVSKRFAASGWRPDDVASVVQGGDPPKGRKPLPNDWFDADGMPRFTISEYFTWKQTFHPGVPVAIHHAYSPSVTTGVPQPVQFLLDEYASATCVDAAMARAIRKRDGEYGVRWADLRYILKTANNWQGPIGDFHLTIRKPSPTAVMSLCFDGELKKTAPTVFEFRQKDFVPDRDLDILFIE